MHIIRLFGFLVNAPENSSKSKLSFTNLSINVIGDCIPNLNNININTEENKTATISVSKIDFQKKSDYNNTQSQAKVANDDNIIYDNSTIPMKYVSLNKPSTKLKSSGFLVLAAGDTCGQTRTSGCKETGDITH